MYSRLFVVVSSLMLLIGSLGGINGDQRISIMGSTNTEVYAYRYIVELYDTQDTLNLEKEVLQFYARYPDSVYLPYVQFIQANLALENEDHDTAQKLYASLMQKNISQEILGELMLNYAYSLANTNNYAQAMYLLQRLDSEIANPSLSELANLQKADIYYKMGHYYSAEKAYKTAIIAFPDNPDIQFSLFSTYLKLMQDNEALDILQKQTIDSDIFKLYLQSWLEYLLNNERYGEFDNFIENTPLGRHAQAGSILDLRIRRSLRQEDFASAANLLKQVKPLTRQFSLYDALIKLSQNKTMEADSVLKILVNDPSPLIAIPAYLERLKLLYRTEPLSAIAQLINYLNGNKNDLMKAELYYTLGYFCYHKEDYPEAIRQLGTAKHYEMNRELAARIDILIAESWYAAGRRDLATDTINRYLNLYPNGTSRDRAWFYLGYISFLEKDYGKAKPCFNELITKYSNSAYINDAYYYLAEMDFYLANYNLALQNYRLLSQRTPDNPAVNLRICQIHYYLGDYDRVMEMIGSLQPSYEVSILKGSTFLAKKDYTAALDQFLLAESFATDNLRKAEAQSYRALCLYQLKRFKEASALYLQLSNAKESPDTYLFLSAKSAYSARDYHQALELYYIFVEQHPESSHYMAALTDIANAYYNMGNYEKAVDDWVNILSRYRNTTTFDDASLSVVRDALLGIELSTSRISGYEIIADLLVLPDTFNSEFIRFELNYLLIKLYADRGLWTELIQAAENVRAQFPDRKPEDVELIITTGLINLNEFEAAEEKLARIYQQSGSNEALLKWADLEMLTENYASALEKLSLSFKSYPSAAVWLKMVECSEADSYNQFDEIWELGSDYTTSNPQVFPVRMRQLYYSGRLDEAAAMGNYLLLNSLSTHDHAEAFLYLGLVDFASALYPSAIATLKRVVLLFPDFSDLHPKAMIHIVKSHLLAGMNTEAEMYLLQYSRFLNQEQVLELNQLLEESK